MNSLETLSNQNLSTLETLNQKLENWEPSNDEEKIALEIVKKLQNLSVSNENSPEPKQGEAYFIGGYARDLAMKNIDNVDYKDFEFSPHDIDIVSNLTPTEILSHVQELQKSLSETYPETNITIKAASQGQRFQVLIINIDIAFPNSSEASPIKKVFEIATYRTESSYIGTRPSQVTLAQSLEEDLQRRDFSINALAFDPISKKIIDPLNAIEDLNNKELKFIGDMETRLREDPIRILRMIRFANKYGMTYDRNLKKFLLENPNILSEEVILDKNQQEIKNETTNKPLKNISRQQKKKEFDRILTSTNAGYAINDLVQLNLMPKIIPELLTQDTKQDPEKHQELIQSMRSLQLPNHPQIKEILCQQMDISADETSIDTYLEQIKTQYGNGLFYTLLLQNLSENLPEKKSKSNPKITNDIDSLLTILTNPEYNTINHFLTNKNDWDVLYSDNEELNREKTYHLLIAPEAKTVSLATFLRKVSKLESPQQIQEAIQNFADTQQALDEAVELWQKHEQKVKSWFKETTTEFDFMQKIEFLPSDLDFTIKATICRKIIQAFEKYLYKHPEITIPTPEKHTSVIGLFVKKLSELQTKENFTQIFDPSLKINFKLLDKLLIETMQDTSLP